MEPLFQGNPSGLRDYLSMFTKLRGLHNFKQPLTIDEVIAEHGHYMLDFSLLPAEAGLPESKECYWNAYQLFMSGGELRYCEGYVQLAGCPIPVMHGWCIDEEGKVIDPSVEQDRERVYYGVVFNTEFVEDVWQVLLDNQRIGILGNLHYLRDSIKSYPQDLIQHFEVQSIAVDA